MLRFAPGRFSQPLNQSVGTVSSTDRTFDYAITTDDYPVFNRVTAIIRNP